jgi:hypothetical protein
MHLNSSLALADSCRAINLASFTTFKRVVRSCSLFSASSARCFWTRSCSLALYSISFASRSSYPRRRARSRLELGTRSTALIWRSENDRPILRDLSVDDLPSTSGIGSRDDSSESLYALAWGMSVITLLGLPTRKIFINQHDTTYLTNTVRQTGEYRL